MVMRRWYPFSELRRMQHNMDHVRRGFATVGVSRERENWAIPLDVVQEDDKVVVQASLPGVNPEDIDVSIENDVLVIRGETSEEREGREGNYMMQERHIGSFRRSLRLSDTLDTERVELHYANGVLTMVFHKLESKQARQFKVPVGAASEGDNGSATA